MITSSNPERTLADVRGLLALVGAGKMGGAMLAGWLERGLDPKNVAVLDPLPSDALTALAKQGLRVNPDIRAVGKAAAIVVAVKPQAANDIVAALPPLVDAATVVVSIMAGKTLASVARRLPSGTALVRAMPNTPAAIGRGITVAVGNKHVTAPQRELAHKLLAATGVLEWVADEALMDAVTAVSGSGPAYVFLLAETFARAGVAAGLPPELAAKLARETIAGAGELLHRSADEPTTLRRNVTSPGGTTEAALEVLMAADGLDPLMRKAIAAAVKRSRELAG
jgi:pyrroline-5-carboxylate reductase